MRYGMVIDVKSCIGCFACAVCCKAHNNLPNEVWWNRIVCENGNFHDVPSGSFETGDLKMSFTPVTCQHCDKPLCVAACPTGASFIDDETGIVGIDNEVCIGCGTCLSACPYDVRRLYKEELEYYVDFPVGDADAPVHVPNTMSKCTFCANRIARGEVPSCMDLCPARARYFGDLDDPTSDASKYLEGREYFQLLTEAGSEPRTYYVT